MNSFLGRPRVRIPSSTSVFPLARLLRLIGCLVRVGVIHGLACSKSFLFFFPFAIEELLVNKFVVVVFVGEKKKKNLLKKG